MLQKSWVEDHEIVTEDVRQLGDILNSWSPTH